MARSRRSFPGHRLDQAFRPIRGVKTAAAGSVLILQAPGWRCVSLGERASRLWTLLERGASLRTIHRFTRIEYGGPSVIIEGELLALIRALVRAGVIEPSA